MTAPDGRSDLRDRSDPPERRRGLLARLGPIAAGMLLDVVDLATYGPAGLYGGFLLGGAVGWWLAGRYGASQRLRIAAAIAAAVYAATPATEFLPLGTLAGVILRLGELRRQP